MTADLYKLRQLRQLRHLGLDLDGTLYRGSVLFASTIPFLEQIRTLGLGHTFLTNNSSRSVAAYERDLWNLGIEARRDQIRTSSAGTIEFLTSRGKALRRLFVLGTESLQAEFRGAGFVVVLDSDEEAPDAVVVGFDPELDFARLCRAAYWIERGAGFIATHPDRVCPTDQPTLLIDCGSICACLEAATGRAPERVFGKPDPSMLQGLLKRHELQPEQLAMVGDRLTTDIAMARSAGVFSVLVLSGATSSEQARRAQPAPDLIVRDVGQLGELLVAQHGPS